MKTEKLKAGFERDELCSLTEGMIISLVKSLDTAPCLSLNTFPILPKGGIRGLGSF